MCQIGKSSDGRWMALLLDIIGIPGFFLWNDDPMWSQGALALQGIGKVQVLLADVA